MCDRPAISNHEVDRPVCEIARLLTCMPLPHSASPRELQLPPHEIERLTHSGIVGVEALVANRGSLSWVHVSLDAQSEVIGSIPPVRRPRKKRVG